MPIKYKVPKNLDKEFHEDFYSQFKGVHLVHPNLPDDTLCGMALSDNVYNADYIKTTEKITCVDCINIVKFCQKYKL